MVDKVMSDSVPRVECFGQNLLLEQYILICRNFGVCEFAESLQDSVANDLCDFCVVCFFKFNVSYSPFSRTKRIHIT